MSKATKRKHVTKEIMEDYYVPEDGEQIVKISSSRGNNLHEVVTEDGNHFLVSMPTKFRKNVWVKRGDFVVMAPIKEGNKVQGEIVYILYQKQIKYLKQEKIWPSGFDEGIQVPNNNEEKMETSKSGKTDSEEESDEELFQNPNRRPVVYCDEDTNSSDEDE